MSGLTTESESAPVQELWRPGPAAVAAAGPQPVQAETDPDWVWELEAALLQALAAVVLAPVRGSEEVLMSEMARPLRPEPVAL